MSRTYPSGSMSTPSVARLLSSYSLPIVINMMIAAICNITDRLFIGDSAGITALSGLALTLPLIVLLTAIGSLIGTGASRLIHQALKRQDTEQANKIIGNAFTLTFFISFLLIFISTGFLKEIIILFGGREQTTLYAIRYLSIIIPGSIFTNFVVGFTSCMRVCGHSRKATGIILTGILLNVLLDFILYTQQLLTIESAAMTTAGSMFFCSILVISHFIGQNNFIRLQKKYLKTGYKTSYKIILSGMTSFFMNLTICTVSIIMNNYLVVHGGNIAIGAYGIISSYTMLIMMFLSGFSQGMQILIRQDRVFGKKKILQATLKTGAIITGVCLLPGEFFSGYFIVPFTSDPSLTELATIGMKVIFCTLPILGFQFIIAGFFQSIDKTKKALFINMSRQFVFLIPSLFIFSGLWGISGVWFAIPFSDLMSAAITGTFLWREKRKILVYGKYPIPQK